MRWLLSAYVFKKNVSFKELLQVIHRPRYKRLWISFTDQLGMLVCTHAMYQTKCLYGGTYVRK